MFRLAILLLFSFLMMSGTWNQKQLPAKSQWLAIVDDFCRAGTDRLGKKKCMTADQWARHINDDISLAGTDDALTISGAAVPLAGGIQINCNNWHHTIHLDPERHINGALPLAGSDDALPLTGAALPLAGSAFLLAGSIWINFNDLHCSILLDPLLKLHDFYGKHNTEGIYHNKITPPVRSSVHCYQVRKTGEPRHDAIRKQGATCSRRLFNPLTQRYGLLESLDGGNHNKYNSVATMVVNINEYLLLPDENSLLFSRLMQPISFFKNDRLLWQR